MVNECVRETFKLLLHSFEYPDYELTRFISTVKINLIADRLYLIKKTLSTNYKNTQYFTVVKKIEKIRMMFQEFSNIELKHSENLFLIRVDDFPHWEYGTEKFERFASIFEKNRIKFLLGITPMLSKNRHNPYERDFSPLTDKEISTIKKFSVIEIALHGLTHQTLKNKYHSEFMGLAEKQTKEKLVKGIQVLKSFNLFPVAFIAPFDTFDKTNFQIFTSHFKIVCGGYPSARTFGFYITPCILNHSVYVASYKPFSGSAKTTLHWLKELKPQSLIVPITLHWAAEVESNFAYVDELLKRLNGHILPWKQLPEIAGL